MPRAGDNSGPGPGLVTLFLMGFLASSSFPEKHGIGQSVRHECCLKETFGPGAPLVKNRLHSSGHGRWENHFRQTQREEEARKSQSSVGWSTIATSMTAGWSKPNNTTTLTKREHEGRAPSM